MEYAYPSTVSPIKTKVRSALREMIVCAFISGIALFATRMSTDLTSSIIGAVICAPILWAVYKLARFVIGS